jgi:NAD(P)-dependent dehydrogenase (short-subunit alcohol dehydrogenase family)
LLAIVAFQAIRCDFHVLWAANHSQWHLVRLQVGPGHKLSARQCTANARRLPVGRVGETQDLAQTYLYLMQEPYSTVQVIVVDGGAVLV